MAENEKAGESHTPQKPGGKQHNEARRDFLKQSSLLTALVLAPPAVLKAAEKKLDEQVAEKFEKVSVTLEINGKKQKVNLEPRVTLLDFLREQQHLTGTKKGCDYGQCGYCTPGQIMSAVACIREGHASSEDEVREFMSGNICRCGAYPNIVKAIMEVKNKGQKV
jgi:xanthine dehydrogenase YagT iron-sulfur-binding subunit